MIVPFCGWHLDLIKPAHEVLDFEILKIKEVREYMETQKSYTIMAGGKPVACMGFSERHPERAEVWAVADRNSRKHFITVHKSAKKLLKSSKYRRIESTVLADWEAAHRWSRALGFTLEAERMRGYGLRGEDHSLYSWVRG